MLCHECGKEFTPNAPHAKFCSGGCKDKNWRDRNKTEVTCPGCGVTRRVVKLREAECRKCSPRKKDFSGDQNPRWRGGHKHWSKGRYGKDKDGLSWKAQRKLAWERDQYTCQHCGVKPKRNPDVHHIDPWMNSQSHSLDNLICLCQKCHLKEEAKVQEQWGGQLVQDKPRYNTCSRCGNQCVGEVCSECSQRDKPYPTCGVCGKSAQRVFAMGCRHCLTAWVIEQRKTRSTRDIAEQIGCSQPSIVQWCKG